MSVKESYAGKINRKLNKKLHVIDVAAGRVPADLVLKNATYVNVFSNELGHGDIAVAEGLIVGMGEYHGHVEVDVSGKLVLPGFLDAHIHLESSLVSPTEFAKAVLPHGTTTGTQRLYLGSDDAALIRGKRIVLMDDVISTGGSLLAMEHLVALAGGTVVDRIAALAEGAAAQRKDIKFLAPLPVFNADGTIK